MHDINFRDRYQLSLRKTLWHPDHLILAHRLCLERDISGEDISIIVDLRTCARKALLEFLNVAFYEVINNDIYSVYKAELFKELKERYDELRLDFYHNRLAKAGYHEKMRPYQVDALFEMAYKKHNLLGFDMGLG